MEAELREKSAMVSEGFDLDFNVGNAVMNILVAEFTETPIESYEKAMFLLGRRLETLKARREKGLTFIPKNSKIVNIP